MKLLVGAACLAIVAFVGQHFWNDWQDHVAAERAAVLVTRLHLKQEEQRGASTKNLELLTATAPDSRKTASAMCRHLVKVEGNEALGSYASYIEDCRTLGLAP